MRKLSMKLPNYIFSCTQQNSAPHSISNYKLLLPFKIIGRFDFFIHLFCYVSKYNIIWREYFNFDIIHIWVNSQNDLQFRMEIEQM